MNKFLITHAVEIMTETLRSCSMSSQRRSGSKFYTRISKYFCMH